MTGSENSSNTCTISKPPKPGQQSQQESCEQITKVPSRSSPSCSPVKGDMSSSNGSSLISHSPHSSLKCHSGFTAHYTKESMVGNELDICPTAGTSGGSGVGHPKMKRTISNCNVRTHNASTLCSQGSSYVYHYPSNVARKNIQPQQQQHRQIQTSPTPSSLAVTCVTANFHLPLCENSAKDETQSMVELCHRPSRLYRSFAQIEKGGNVNSHASTRTTQCAADLSQAMEQDHPQHSSHQITQSQASSHTTQSQESSRIALEWNRGNVPVSGVQQKQRSHKNHRQQSNNRSTHCHTLQHPTHQNQMMKSHLDLSRGWSCAPKPRAQQVHTSNNACLMKGGITRASSGQVPKYHTLRSLSLSATDKKIMLHIPSGRKHESLI